MHIVLIECHKFLIPIDCTGCPADYSGGIARSKDDHGDAGESVPYYVTRQVTRGARVIANFCYSLSNIGYTTRSSLAVLSK